MEIYLTGTATCNSQAYQEVIIYSCKLYVIAILEYLSKLWYILYTIASFNITYMCQYTAACRHQIICTFPCNIVVTISSMLITTLLSTFSPTPLLCTIDLILLTLHASIYNVYRYFLDNLKLPCFFIRASCSKENKSITSSFWWSLPLLFFRSISTMAHCCSNFRLGGYRRHTKYFSSRSILTAI